MDNATRRQLLNRHKQSNFPGSIMDVYKAYEQGVDLIEQFQQQSQPKVASTPQQQQQGLRPQHQAGNTNASMAFPNTPPNASFNTVGMKAPIDIKQFDQTGNLVKSFDAVPPGITNLKMSSQGGMVLETPSKMQSGGISTGAPRVPAMSDAEMSLKILQEANAGNPAARRMRSDYGQRMFLPRENYPSTHYMASMDNYAVPLIQEDYIGGPLRYNENPPPSKSDFNFDTPEQAAYFAKNYKQASAAKTFKQKTGGVKKYQYAGAVNLPPAEVIGYSNVNVANPNYFNQGAINEYRPGRWEAFKDAMHEHNSKDDSALENLAEFFDPSGGFSWDDAYRAYNSMQARGATYPNLDEGLDMFGALPLVGKFKRSINLGKGAAKHVGDIKNLGASAYNALTKGADVINRVDAIEDESGFLDNKKTGGVRKRSIKTVDRRSKIRRK